MLSAGAGTPFFGLKGGIAKITQIKRDGSGKASKDTDDKKVSRSGLFAAELGYLQNFANMGFGLAAEFGYMMGTFKKDKEKTGVGRFFTDVESKTGVAAKVLLMLRYSFASMTYLGFEGGIAATKLTTEAKLDLDSDIKKGDKASRYLLNPVIGVSFGFSPVPQVEAYISGRYISNGSKMKKLQFNKKALDNSPLENVYHRGLEALVGFRWLLNGSSTE